MANALLIIDFQNDFVPGGALAVEGGDEIAEPIQKLAPHFDVVAATRDWHPPDHVSFETEGGPWPVHCVQGTPGAELHPAMDGVHVDFIVDIGRKREDEGYAGFEKSDLAEQLRRRGVERGRGLRSGDRLLRAGLGYRRLPGGVRRHCGRGRDPRRQCRAGRWGAGDRGDEGSGRPDRQLRAPSGRNAQLGRDQLDSALRFSSAACCSQNTEQ